MEAVEPYPMPENGDPTPDMGMIYYGWLVTMWWYYIGVPVIGLKYPYERPRYESRQVRRQHERKQNK